MECSSGMHLSGVVCMLLFQVFATQRQPCRPNRRSMGRLAQVWKAIWQLGWISHLLGPVGECICVATLRGDRFRCLICFWGPTRRAKMGLERKAGEIEFAIADTFRFNSQAQHAKRTCRLDDDDFDWEPNRVEWDIMEWNCCRV